MAKCNQLTFLPFKGLTFIRRSYMWCCAEFSCTHGCHWWDNVLYACRCTWYLVVSRQFISGILQHW